MVILVSAMFVARTIFLTPSSGLSNINLCMQNNIKKESEKFTSIKWMISFKSENVIRYDVIHVNDI